MQDEQFIPIMILDVVGMLLKIPDRQAGISA